MTLERFSDATVVIIAEEREAHWLTGLLSRQGLRDIRVLAEEPPHAALVRDLEPDLVVLGLAGEPRFVARLAEAAAGAHVPVLLLTDRREEAEAGRALQAGPRDFLLRPMVATEAVARIENLLENRYLHHELRFARQREADELDPLRPHPSQAKTDEILRAMTASPMRMRLQPITDLDTGKGVGYEAKVGFDSAPARPAESWLTDAADVGLGYALELNALGQALDALDELPRRTFLCVKISVETMLSPGLLPFIHDEAAPRLLISLVERFPAEDPDAVQHAIAGLRARGVRVAVAHTAVGYSSLRHTYALRPDYIELESPLVHGVDRDPARKSLAAALSTFATEMHTGLIAEDVQTTSERATLRSLGVRLAAGAAATPPRRSR